MDDLLRPVTADHPEISVVVPSIPSNDHGPVIDRLRANEGVSFEMLVANDDEVGVCEARNAGLEAAEADIVAFTDDDCQPPDDWLASIRDHFEADPELVCLEGPVEGGMEYEGRRKYPTCNLAVDRDTAISVGGFREEFEYWREDTEFGWRLEENGNYKFANDTLMVHPPRPRSSIKKANEKRLKSEYPEKYNKIIVPDTVIGRMNDWLWRNGIWDAIDRIRYRGEHQ